MDQSFFEANLMNQLVMPIKRNEINVPQWCSNSVFFYDKFDFFDNITKDEYTELVLAMIAKGLLSYEKHGYQEDHRERWTISVAFAGFKALGLVDEQC